MCFSCVSSGTPAQQQQQDTESEHTPEPEDTSRAQLRTHVMDVTDTNTERDFPIALFFGRPLHLFVSS